MGNCFSDPSKPPGKGQRLGSAPSSAPASAASSGTTTQGGTASARTAPPPRALGGGDAGGDPREAALKAAEERAKLASTKGVSASNPKAGKLSAKLEAERRGAAGTAGAPGGERMMDAGQWN